MNSTVATHLFALLWCSPIGSVRSLSGIASIKLESGRSRLPETRRRAVTADTYRLHRSPKSQASYDGRDGQSDRPLAPLRDGSASQRVSDADESHDEEAANDEEPPPMPSARGSVFTDTLSI